MRFFRRLPLRRLRLTPRIRILLLALVLGLVVYLRFGWLPTVRELVIMEVDNETSNLINEAVDAYIAQGQLRYDDLVALERTAELMMAAFHALPKEKQRELLSATGKIVTSTGATARELLDGSSN